MMSQRTLSLIALLIIALTAGQAASQSPGKLEAFGLQGRRMTALGVSPEGEYLYAATESEGVFRRALFHPDSSWKYLGLEGKRITALDIQVSGRGPAIILAPVASVRPDYFHGDSTLIYRFEQNRWIPADSGLMKNSSITGLTSFASSGHEPPGATFTILDVDFDLIFRSNAWSYRWKQISHGMVGAQINVIAVNHHRLTPEVWFGGAFEFTPWLGKSTDNGETWKTFIPQSFLILDHGCYSLAFHPQDPATVYAGTTRTVMKTIDGGKTWQVTGLVNNQTVLYGLAVDPFNPNHLYAGGVASSTQWALFESLDGGSKWQEIPAPSSAGNASGISSLVADPKESGVIYISRFGGGVWRYQNKFTTVANHETLPLPKEFALAQNYPNPFSANGTPAGNAETVIYYSLSSSQPVKLEMYNVLGELVATLVDEAKPAGEHGIRWNARNAAGALVPAGIYFYRLRLGVKNILTRKMILLH